MSEEKSNSISLLREIVEKRGAAYLREDDGKLFVNAFAEMGGDRQSVILLRYLIRCGGHEDLLDAANLTPAMQRTYYSQTVQKLCDSTLISESSAHRICAVFWRAVYGKEPPQDYHPEPVPQPVKTAEELYQEAQNCQDQKQKVNILRQAAAQGHLDAMLHLGFAYEYGNGTSKNPYEAIRWFRQAANQGLAPAQDRMAHCYEKGVGVERNLEKAVEWCKCACQQDFPGSTRHLHQLERLLREERQELFPELSGQEFGILNDVLVKYNGSAPDVVVPGGVKRIGARAFENNRAIRSVILPDKLLGIGVDAFAGCANLQEVVVPGSVVALNLECFGGCGSLKKLVLQPGVQKLIFGEKIAQLRCIRIEVPNTVTSVTWSSMGADEQNIRMKYPKKIIASGKWEETFQRFFEENPDFTRTEPYSGEPKYLLFRPEHSKQERQLLILGWICLLASAVLFVYSRIAGGWNNELGYIGGAVMSFFLVGFYFFFPVLRKQIFLLNRIKTWQPTQLGWRIAYSIWETIEVFPSSMAVIGPIFCIPVVIGDHSMLWLWLGLFWLPFGIYHVCWRRWSKRLK